MSIAFDPPSVQAEVKTEYGIGDVPMLSDTEHQVSQDYGVLQWAVASGEPGHTFILVDERGIITWIRDYGAPENGGVMYVPPEEIASLVESNLE